MHSYVIMTIMPNIIQQTLLEHLPKYCISSSGWHVFNAVCCVHRGETQDKRRRGGIYIDNDKLVYSCFNCGFKAGWSPGKQFSPNFRNLLKWTGIDDKKLSLQALKISHKPNPKEVHNPAIHFEPRPLPLNCMPIDKSPRPIVDYCDFRSLPRHKTLWSPEMPERIIIPYVWKNKTMGYTARSIHDKMPKYMSQIPPNMIYGIDDQKDENVFAIVSEGIIDAACINGISVGGNNINKIHAKIIDSLNKEIIVVPDRDIAGQKMIDCAIQSGWSVSFPEWEPGIKDINDAVMKYGKLFTLQSIWNAKETGKLKINLMRRRIDY